MSDTYDKLLKILAREKKLAAIRKVVKEHFVIDKDYVKGKGRHPHKVNRQTTQTLILEMCNIPYNARNGGLVTQVLTENGVIHVKNYGYYSYANIKALPVADSPKVGAAFQGEQNVEFQS